MKSNYLSKVCIMFLALSAIITDTYGFASWRRAFVSTASQARQRLFMAAKKPFTRIGTATLLPGTLVATTQKSYDDTHHSLTDAIMRSLWNNEKSSTDVTQISDSLYTSKVTEDFYLAIERIDMKNLEMWRDYADIQVNAGRRTTSKYLPSIDGSAHFRKVLEGYAEGIISSDNEVWIAYASRVPVTQPAQLGEANPHIEMFVSVTTSPKALLTSHMGISRTYEAALDLQDDPPTRKKHPNQSLHLHAFAAQVMKLRNPERVYMLTAPTPIMRTLLLNKLPTQAVSVGDSTYHARIESAQKDPQTLLDEFDLRIRPEETQEAREKRLSEIAQCRYNHYFKTSEKLDLLKSHPPRIILVKEGNEKKQFIIRDAHGKTVVAFDRNDATYQWLFTPAFTSLGLSIPYVMIDLDQLAAFGKIVPDRAPHE